MKLIFIIFTLISLKSCAQTENAVITYDAETRGFYYHVVLNKENLMVQKTRTAQTGTEIKLTEAQWDEIEGMLKKIDVSQMENLKADSSKSMVDAAAMATLKVKLPNENIHSCSFDHGNPPKELEQLVNTILTLSETVEKQ